MESTDGEKKLVINDPWGEQKERGQEEFLKQWAHLKLLCLTLGYSNYFIAFGTRDEKLPPRSGKGLASANAITKGLADVPNGFAAIRQSRILGGLGQMLRGVFTFAYGVVRLLMYNIRPQAKPISKP